jgi:(p)ppGpp synthase/HD superfamily hydrolase
LEDTWASYNDVKDNFNTRIADLVYLVTDELGKNRTERALKTYPKIRTDASAVYIKLCDRISNVQEAIVHGPLDMGKAYLKQHETFRYALYKEGEFEKLWNFYFELIDKLTEILEGDNAINS